MLIRVDEQRDQEAVFAINASAFETEAEANLVDALRERARPFVSLVAEVEGWRGLLLGISCFRL